MTIEQWWLFSVPHPMWHGASVYNCYLRGCDTHTYCRAFSDLCLSRLGFEHPTFRLRGQRFNPLRHRRGLYICNRRPDSKKLMPAFETIHYFSLTIFQNHCRPSINTIWIVDRGNKETMTINNSLMTFMNRLFLVLWMKYPRQSSFVNSDYWRMALCRESNSSRRIDPSTLDKFGSLVKHVK